MRPDITDRTVVGDEQDTHRSPMLESAHITTEPHFRGVV